MIYFLCVLFVYLAIIIPTFNFTLKTMSINKKLVACSVELKVNFCKNVQEGLKSADDR